MSFRQKMSSWISLLALLHCVLIVLSARSISFVDLYFCSLSTVFRQCAARIRATSDYCSSLYFGFLSSRRFAGGQCWFLWHAFLFFGAWVCGFFLPFSFLLDGGLRYFLVKFFHIYNNLGASSSASGIFLYIRAPGKVAIQRRTNVPTGTCTYLYERTCTYYLVICYRNPSFANVIRSWSPIR
jgi:hypothetical protein